MTSPWTDIPLFTTKFKLTIELVPSQTKYCPNGILKLKKKGSGSKWFFHNNISTVRLILLNLIEKN